MGHLLTVWFGTNHMTSLDASLLISGGWSRSLGSSHSAVGAPHTPPCGRCWFFQSDKGKHWPTQSPPHLSSLGFGVKMTPKALTSSGLKAAILVTTGMRQDQQTGRVNHKSTKRYVPRLVTDKALPSIHVCCAKCSEEHVPFLMYNLIGKTYVKVKKSWEENFKKRTSICRVSTMACHSLGPVFELAYLISISQHSMTYHFNFENEKAKAQRCSRLTLPQT